MGTARTCAAACVGAALPGGTSCTDTAGRHARCGSGASGSRTRERVTRRDVAAVLSTHALFPSALGLGSRGPLRVKKLPRRRRGLGLAASASPWTSLPARVRPRSGGGAPAVPSSGTVGCGPAPPWTRLLGLALSSGGGAGTPWRWTEAWGSVGVAADDHGAFSVSPSPASWGSPPCPPARRTEMGSAAHVSSLSRFVIISG